MPKKYRVELSATERAYLEGIVAKGRVLARKRQHAQVLLKADEGCLGPAWTDERIAEAKLIALACSAAPQGRRRWTIRLLADKLVELQVVDSIGRETVRTTLKKTNLSLG